MENGSQGQFISGHTPGESDCETKVEVTSPHPPEPSSRQSLWDCQLKPGFWSRPGGTAVLISVTLALTMFCPLPRSGVPLLHCQDHQFQRGEAGTGHLVGVSSLGHVGTERGEVEEAGTRHTDT